MNETELIEKCINLKPYVHNNELIKSLRKLIKNKYDDIFFCVLVHGSVATNEIIPYSDFDGLIIVKDKFIGSIELNDFIHDSMEIIYEFDPLQHHGWSIMSDNKLKDYPQTYFPHEIFAYSRIINPEKKITFKISFNSNINYSKPLFSHLKDIEKKVINNIYPKNIYQLKSFLSELMLIPTLYIQAKNFKGVFKKQSFSMAKKDFSDKSWNPIQIASRVRQDWSYDLNPVQKIISKNQNNYLIRELNKRFLAPKIPKHICDTINDDFYKEILHFIKEIRINLDS